ncbi:TaqI-like C-terminal specificity domain-containing protein [uncultured Draconibacterium sp.]|uniref:Eco57I restriction-modification methylase domain-containing protein n=1 Tax=uncultured Draconibacterium sp. TaxID=1573823 RepID=UPI003217CF9C
MKNSFREIFKKKYKRKRWQSVLIQIMGDDKISYHLSPSSVELTETQLKKVHEVLNIGTIQTSDNKELPIFEVHLNKNVVIERNRVTVNEIIKQHLIKDARDGAVAVYYYPNYNKTEWRFSFISPGTENSFFEELEVESTNSKRYTYVFGVAEEEHRTAAQQFSVLAESKKTLDDFYEAFNVEKMSKQFFDDYKEHYELFIEYLLSSNFKISAFNANEKTVRDFVKKLLGRVIFIYFIQKKGWLGASTTDYEDGDKNFLQNFFNQSKNEVFYSNWLSKLFFDTLNQQRENDDFEMPDGSMVKIPFLNGGLFDKVNAKYDWLTFPTKRFEELFNFLNRYNFTIYEDSPDDHTVAVDPEMLGHIFENLLEDNKDKGAYYTPKEIVQYMTQESLIEYLYTHLPHIDKNYLTLLVKYKTLGNIFELKDNIDDIDHLLDKVKICDPAIGSGAFPMGLLQEIFSLKDLLIHDKGYDFKDKAKVKEHIIQNSIYGVDIEQGAVDIARLRFWLSLVVYEDIPKPLPNLDFKIVVGDSLLTKFEDQVMHIDWEVKSAKTGKMIAAGIRKELQSLSQMQKKYFEGADKVKLKKEIREIKLDIIEKQLKFNQAKYNEYNSIQGNVWEKKLKRTKKQKLEVQNFGLLLNKVNDLRKHPEKELQFFDWKLNFPEILNPTLAGDNTGFDIVIGNPPYVDIKNLPPELVKILFEEFSTTVNRINLYSIFIEQGIGLQNKNGIISYIIPNSILLNSSYKKTRGLLVDNIKTIVKLPDNIFENAFVETITFVASKRDNEKLVNGAYYKNDEQINFQNLRIKRFKRENWKEDKNNKFNIFISPEITTLLGRIEKNTNKLIDYCDFSLGITPYDKYKGHSPDLIKNKEFHSKEKLNNDYVPLISGKNIVRYFIDDKNINEYLKYGDWLGAPRQKRFFTAKRVIVRQIVSGNPLRIYAGYTDEELYFTQIGFSLISKNYSILTPKTICAILNSSLINFYHKYQFLDIEKNTFQKILIENCKQFPIPKLIDSKYSKIFDNVLDYLLYLDDSKDIPLNDFVPNSHLINLFDEIIDALVFELYFPNEFQKADIQFAKYVERDFQSIEGLNETEKKGAIHEAYQKLRDKHNEIRNNLILMDIRLAEIVMPIKNA